jgi:chromosomal replication initiation ATPase DnaA
MTRYTAKTPFTNSERQLIDKIESCVCSHLNVETTNIKKKNLTTNVTLARGLIFYILHKEFSFSISLIANLYNRSVRNVFWHNDKITHYLKQTTYKALYLSIIKDIQKQ